MLDEGHIATEELLQNTEKEVAAVYGRAVRELKKKSNDFLKDFAKQNEKMLERLDKGEITEEYYEKWKRDFVLRNRQLDALVDTLATDCANADQIAMSIVNGHIPEAYAINRNFAAFEVESGSLIDTSFTLYNRQAVEKLIAENTIVLPKPRVEIPKDKAWNVRHIRNELTQGILQGESIPKIAQRLVNVVGMDESAAIRNARTAMTGAQNAGRADTYMEAKEKGIDFKQMWMATLDNRTRHTHAVMDGELVDVGEKFSNGCYFPGDPEGPPNEVYNCRCRMVAHLTGFSFSDKPLPRDNRLGNMSYEDWKAYHQQKINERRNRNNG